MTKKQALKAVVFLTVFLWLLVTVTYIIRTNGDVKAVSYTHLTLPTNSLV